MPTPTSRTRAPCTSDQSRLRSRLKASASMGASKKSNRPAWRSYRFCVRLVASSPLSSRGVYYPIVWRFVNKPIGPILHGDSRQPPSDCRVAYLWTRHGR